MNKDKSDIFELLKSNNIEGFLKEFDKNPEYYVTVTDNMNNYLINYIIINNNITLLNHILQYNPKLDIINNDGRTLLYEPIKYDYMNIIQSLLINDNLNIGISLIDLKDNHENIPLHYAIMYKNIKITKLLLEHGSNVDKKDSNGNNALIFTIQNGNDEIFDEIIRYVKNINMINNIGENALHIAINYNRMHMITKLLETNIDVNITDKQTQLSPLMYSIILKNNKIIKLLLLNKNIDVNNQDYLGNTALHYACLESNYDACKLLIENPNLNYNLYNEKSMLAIHILLKKNIYDEGIMRQLIINSNLNYQDVNGNTPFLYLSIKNWKTFKEELSIKKLNCYITNNKKQTPISFIHKDDLDEYETLIANSYLYYLNHYINVFKDEIILEPWQIECNKTNKPDNKCKENILNNMKNTSCSYYKIKLKSNSKGECIKLDYEYVNICTFVGTLLDILMGLLYLLKTHPSTCSPISLDFDINIHRKKEDFQTMQKYNNFEILWMNGKLYLSKNFEEQVNDCIKNKNVRFIIIPLGIDLVIGDHANYLIYDKTTNEIERFEPYGNSQPYDYLYDDVNLDNILKNKLKFMFNMNYISPKDYLPKIGFQYFDLFDEKNYIGDPSGFCGLWSIFYIDMRLTYPSIHREKLVKKIIKEIKKHGKGFKSLIRNYSTKITNFRDDIFNGTNITINKWINSEITTDELNVIQNKIHLLLLNK